VKLNNLIQLWVVLAALFSQLLLAQSITDFTATMQKRDGFLPLFYDANSDKIYFKSLVLTTHLSFKVVYLRGLVQMISVSTGGSWVRPV
jgi:hypothetical protein